MTILSLAAFFALVGCDADGGEPNVHLRSFDGGSLVAEQVYGPTPGGGGCEGCVQCFARSSIFGGLCLATNASYTGKSLAAGDDIDLVKLLGSPADVVWQMSSMLGGEGVKSAQMCLADGCTSNPIFAVADSKVNLWVPLRPGQPDVPPRELLFGRIGKGSVAQLWEWGQGPWIGVPEGLGANTSGISAVSSGHADWISTPDAVTAAMAHITYPSDHGGLASCSGFIVSPRHVLTAAHCFARDPASLCTNRMLYFGEIPDGLDIRIGGMHSPSHPQFATGIHHAETLEFHCDPSIDLAVITLAEPTCAAPLPLADPSAPMAALGSSATAYGYGVSRLPDTIKGERYDWGRLKRVKLATADLLSALPESPYLLTYTATSGSVGICRGDSGGPVLRALGGQPKVVGVTFARVHDLSGEEPDKAKLEPVGVRSFAWSRHNACGDEPLRGFVATRVNHPDVHAWISQRIDGFEDESCSYLPVEPPVTK